MDKSIFILLISKSEKSTSNPSLKEFFILISFNEPLTFIKLTVSSQLDSFALIEIFLTFKYNMVKKVDVLLTDSDDSEEQIILDGNELSKGSDYFAVGGRSVSPDNNWLAYSLDTLSRRFYTIYFKNLSSGKVLKHSIPNTSGSVAWANDNQTIFYTSKNQVTLLSEKIYRHKLDTSHEQDVLVYENSDDKNVPKIRTVPTGKGQQIIDAHKEESRKQNQMRSFLMWMIIIAVVGYALLIAQDPLLGILAGAVIYIAFRYSSRNADALVPNLLINNAEQQTAPFHDATGSHAGALLGDVRHDPFQSGGMETPAHERVEAGAIHKAHKGVLFIDEINTLELRSQQMLMTAVQERKFSITGQSERSSGAMVQTEPVPTDFIMIAAGNLDAMQHMHPALRNRIKGYPGCLCRHRPRVVFQLV